MLSKTYYVFLPALCLALVVSNLVIVSLTDYSSKLGFLESLFEIEFKKFDTTETARQIAEVQRSLSLNGSQFDVQHKFVVLHTLQNQFTQSNDEVERSGMGVTFYNKLRLERPLRTRHIIKKYKKEVSKKPGPLYSDHVINPYPYKLTRSPGGCKSVSPPNGNVFLLILVACRYGEVGDRSMIRKTWGKVKVHKGKSILVRFLVGLPHTPKEESMIEQEIAEYGDIIQGDFVDSYKNMTLKVLMGLKWAGLKCPNATYVMNLDSDMFVNVYNLVPLLESSPRVKFAIGHLHPITLPERKRRAKWYTSLELYPERTYPPYLNGPAYVMSGDLPGCIFNESLHVRYIPWDDVFIGLVMNKINLTLLGGDHFEEYPNLTRISDVFDKIRHGIATYIGHRLEARPVFIEKWNNISMSVSHQWLP